MSKIQKPAWLIFGEQCRDQLGEGRISKSGNREQDRIYRWWLEAREKHAYPGTERDWLHIVGWRGRR